MEMYYVREFIKETQGQFGKRQIVFYFPCLVFSVIDIILSIYVMHNMNMARLVVGYNIPIIAAFLAGLILGRRDWLILGYALTLTGYVCQLFDYRVLCAES